MLTTASCSASTPPGRWKRSLHGLWSRCGGSCSEASINLARYREEAVQGGAMRLRRDEPIQIKTPAQIAIMREAGLVTAAALQAAVAAVAAGISTAELDAIAEREIRMAGAVPSFKGYHGYPATICTSVNDQIVHGIPSSRLLLQR